MINDIEVQRMIKFRGKSVADGRWVYGDLSQCADDYPTISGSYINPCDYEELDEENVADDVKVLASTVGQFTSLTDNNGKEIYEGDLLKVDYDNGGHYFRSDAAEVYFHQDDASFCVRSDGQIDTRFSFMVAKISEIVGNIHENPELIESEGK